MTIANEAYARQYRVALPELIGKTPAEFFAHDIEAGKSGWRAMFDAGHLHVETDERRMDGTPVRIEGHYLCVYDERGRITGHIGIQRDITDRHRAAEEIARSRAYLRGRLDDGMIAVRRIVTELRPSVLDQLGLADAIEWQAQDFAARTGLALELDIRCESPSPSGAVASAVFRMLQEALTNVAKH